MRTIASFRWSRWPYTKTYGVKLDALQRKFLTALMQIKNKPGEPYDAFVQRRHISGGHLATACGRWSQAWASSVTSWDAHVQRAHDTNAWSHALLDWQPDAWLTLQRFLFSALHESRTRTRSYRSKYVPLVAVILCARARLGTAQAGLHSRSSSSASGVDHCSGTVVKH